MQHYIQDRLSLLTLVERGSRIVVKGKAWRNTWVEVQMQRSLTITMTKRI